MSQNLQQLKQDRDSIQQAIRSGITSVSVGGQTTTFADPREMRSILADIEREIAQCQGTVDSRPRVSSFNLTRGV